MTLKPTSSCPVAAGWCEMADNIKMLEAPGGHPSFKGYALTTDGTGIRVKAMNGSSTSTIGFLHSDAAVQGAMLRMVGKGGPRHDLYEACHG